MRRADVVRVAVGHHRPEGGTRLDEATKLDTRVRRLVLRPRCGEATITAITAPRDCVLVGTPDPERSEREAARRAAIAVRRLVCEHRLVRMWTLTLAQRTTADDLPLVVRAVQGFCRKLRRAYPRLVWLAVLEWHPGGHGWHVHMVVNRFVPKVRIGELWGLGFVDARLIVAKGDTKGLSSARRAGQYVAKYLTKSEDETAPGHVKGDHRYLRPLGLQWTEVEAEGPHCDLVALVWQHLGSVTWSWFSGTDEKWRGPACWVFRGG